METIYLRNISDIKKEIPNLSLVLGFFDGVHIGHSQLISFARDNTPNGSLGVLTFDKALKSIEGVLMSNEDKEREMEKLGVDYLFVIVCDDDFKHIIYTQFVDNILKKFNPTKIFCGPDFKYGYEAKGDVAYLKTRFSQVYVLNFVKDFNEDKISSTRIKELIKNGEVQEAKRYLGKPYKITGTVVHGLNNGIKLGFPTANINPLANYVVPKRGVYFTKTEVDGVLYNSVTNIGLHPSLSPLNNFSIETNIIGYDKNIYGENISIYFYLFERNEITFSSLEELKERINEDVHECQKFFKY